MTAPRISVLDSGVGTGSATGVAQILAQVTFESAIGNPMLTFAQPNVYNSLLRTAGLDPALYDLYAVSFGDGYVGGLNQTVTALVTVVAVGAIIDPSVLAAIQAGSALPILRSLVGPTDPDAATVDYVDAAVAGVQISDVSIASAPGAGKEILARAVGKIADSGLTPIWLVGDSNMRGSNPGPTGFLGGPRHVIERVLRQRRSDFDFVGHVKDVPENSSMGSLAWHSGVPGDKIEDATTNFAARIAACLSVPKVTVHALGVNNLTAGDASDVMMTKLLAWEALILGTHPDMRIVYVPPFVVDGTTTNATLAGLQTIQGEYRAALLAHVNTDPRLIFCDAAAGFGKAEFVGDGIHWNRTGQEAAGAAVAEAIDRHLGRPARRGATLPRPFRQRKPQYSYLMAAPASDQLTIAAPNGYNVPASSYAVAIDYYPTSLPSVGLSTLIASGPYNDAATWFQLYQQGSALRLYFNTAAGTIFSGPSELCLVINRWHRIVVLAYRNGSNSLVGMYVNGKLVGLASGVAAWTGAGSQTTYVGKGTNFVGSVLGYVSRPRAFAGSTLPAPGTMQALLAVEDDYFLDAPIIPGTGTAHHDLDGVLSDDVYGGGPLVVGGTAALTAPWPGGTPLRPWEITADYPDDGETSADVLTALASNTSPVNFNAQRLINIATPTTTGDAMAHGKANDSDIDPAPAAGQEALATIVANRTISAAVLARAASYGAPLPTWDPSWDSSCVAWYLADDATVVSGAVSVLPDRVRSGADPFMQTVAGSRPAYEATGWMGHPSFLFDGIDDFLSAEALSGYESGDDLAFTVAFSIQPIDAALQTVFSFGRASVDTSYLKIDADGVGDHWNLTKHDDAAGTGFQQSASLGGLSKHIIIAVFHGTTVTLLLDDVNVINNLAFNVGVTTLDRCTLGAFGRSTTTGFAHVRMREFVMFNRALTIGVETTRLYNSLVSRSPTF